MRRKAVTDKPTAERVVKGVRRKTRKHHSAEEKIRILRHTAVQIGQG